MKASERLPFISKAPLIRNGITIELDLPYQVREIILARPFVGRNGLGGGSFLRQKKTNEQNDSVLLRFVKPFNLFFKYCVGHFSTSLSLKGIAPLMKTLCILPNPLPNYKRSDSGEMAAAKGYCGCSMTIGVVVTVPSSATVVVQWKLSGLLSLSLKPCGSEVTMVMAPVSSFFEIVYVGAPRV